MSPKYNVSLEFHKKKGVVEPVAATLNNAREQILAGTNTEFVEFKSVGRVVSFCVECDGINVAINQVTEMAPLSLISNPVMERLVSVKISEVNAFEQ